MTFIFAPKRLHKRLQKCGKGMKRDEKGISLKKNEQVLRKIHKESAATNDMLVVKTSRKH